MMIGVKKVTLRVKQVRVDADCEELVIILLLLKIYKIVKLGFLVINLTVYLNVVYFICLFSGPKLDLLDSHKDCIAWVYIRCKCIR